MDGRELNRIAAALLCACVAFGAADWVGMALEPARAPAQAAFAIPGAPADASAGAPARAAIESRLSSASSVRGGQATASLCVSCHSFDKGGRAMIGPDLYGVAQRGVAAVPDYQYSAALTQIGGRWTPARLDEWLTSPQAFAPGTRMGFAGIRDEAARADMIAYLLTLVDQPAAAASRQNFAALVAHADPKAGETIAIASCSACHSVEAGASPMIGPNLHGVFGRGIAEGPDYRYSTALSRHGGAWTIDSLNRWLFNPRQFAPGTKMAFPGLGDDRARAAVVAYLHSLSGGP